MANPMWRFLLCQNDSTMTAIGELTKAQNRSLELLLNRPGSFRFNINGDDEVGKQIVEGSTCIKAYRDDICRWSGPVWNVTDSLPAKTMEVAAVGWMEELNVRILEDFDPRVPSLNEPQFQRARYDNIDAGLIAYGLLGFANEQRTDSGVLVPSHIVAGVRDSSQLRKRNYEKFSNIGASIQELSDIEAGFDYAVGPERAAGGNPLNIYYQLIKAGSGLYGKGQDRPNTLFSIGWGPNNLRSFTRTVDVSQMRNRIVTSGRFGASRAGNVASQATYGIFEEQISLSDVTDPTILQAFAMAEVAVRATPRVIYTMSPFPWTSHSTNNVPRLFDDYDIGDIVYSTAVGGRLNIQRQAIRVFGATIEPTENGTENISAIHTAPTS